MKRLKNECLRPGWRRLAIICLCIAALSGICLWFAVRPSLTTVTERGWRAYQQNDLDNLQRQMVLAERLEKQSAAARFLLGAFLLATNESNLALTPLRDASADPKLHFRAQLLASRAYLNLHQFLDAEQLLVDCLREAPEDVAIHRLLAAMYYDLGANPLAIEHLEAVSRLAPTDARPMRLIGLMRKDFQDFSAAVAAYRTAASRLPNEPLASEVRLELAECLVELREYAEALAALTAADQSGEAVAVRLLCFRVLARMVEARQQLDIAVQIENPPLALTIELGNYFDAVGDLKRATEYFELAVQQDPLDFVPRYKLSTAYVRQNRKEDAAEQLRQMEKNRGSYDRLHALQNQAMREPHNATVRYEIGVASLALGRKELARIWFNAAIGLNPGYQAARAALKSL
jgi:tetratricopeptide (TPR) repeat protein